MYVIPKYETIINGSIFQCIEKYHIGTFYIDMYLYLYLYLYFLFV